MAPLRRSCTALLLALAPSLGLTACSEKKPAPAGPVAESAPSSVTLAPAVSAVALEESAGDAGAALAIDAAAEPENAARAEPPGPHVSTTQLVSSIYEKPSFVATKLGVLRAGTKVTRGAAPVSKAGCPGGWYAVEPRGFVCEGHEGVTTNMEDPAVVAAAPFPARANAPFPYGYGTSWGAPFYVRVPTPEEQKKHEGDIEARAAHIAKVRSKLSAHRQWPFLGMPVSPLPKFLEGHAMAPNLTGQKLHESAVVGGNAWPGMRLSFLTMFEAEGRAFYLTTEHYIVPADRMRPARLADFHGVELAKPGEPGAHLPMAWTLWKPARVYKIDGRGGAQPTKIELPPQTPMQIGREHQFGSVRFIELAEPPEGVDDKGAKYIVRAADMPRMEPETELPTGVGEGDTWIDVSIARQMAVLYKGKTPLFITLVSTGVDGAQDSEKTKSTPRGVYRMRSKYITSRMRADEKPAAQDGDKPDPRYRVDDVSFVQFFHAGYAFHGAYWHDSFGQAKSHGCINLSPRDALYLFGATEPKLPPGWHGVTAGAGGAEQGSFVRVRVY